MQTTAFHKTPSAVPGASEAAGKLVGGLFQTPMALIDRLFAWQQQAQERGQLRRLSDHQLRDLGLSRREAEQMARKAFWSRPV